MNQVAGVAVTLGKALLPAWKEYGAAVLRNAKALAAGLSSRGGALVTGGTDNHMLVLETVGSYGMDGKEAEETLDRVGITTNKQVIPDDPNPPLRPSGIRIGTPAATTRGMDEADMERLAGWIDRALREREDAAAMAGIAKEVERFCADFPVPGL